MDLGRMVEVTVDELSKVGKQHSCVYAASVVLNILFQGKIRDAFPLTVKVRIFNPIYHERLKSCGERPPTELELAEWTEAGARGVSIGEKPPAPGEWPAHLVVVVPQALRGRPVIIDISIPQVNVPHWGIQFLPLSIVSTEQFLLGVSVCEAHVNGSLAVYTAFPSDLSYERENDWSNDERKHNIVQRIVSRLGHQ